MGTLVSAETTNLYTAFLNLIIGLLKPGGELVAINTSQFMQRSLLQTIPPESFAGQGAYG